ncbi:MAG: phosphatidylcholine/phosphatidylserine synthase [Pacificimonas sp.]
MKVERPDGHRRLSSVLPIRALIPNAITVAALCSGLTAVRFAMADEFEKALLAIFLAGVLDMADGRIARMLKGSTRFGAELDSLSDNAAFGVAPALIVYFWTLQYLPGIGWIVALAHAVCAALRLARFNANLDVDDVPHKKHGFLTGVPAPVGAGLTLSPMFLFYWLEPTNIDYPTIGAGFTAIVVAVSAFLMISNIPTYSWKVVSLPRHSRLFALVGVALLLGALLSAPFMTLSLISIAYAATIPFSLRKWRRIKRRGEAPPAPAANADEVPGGPRLVREPAVEEPTEPEAPKA